MVGLRVGGGAFVGKTPTREDGVWGTRLNLEQTLRSGGLNVFDGTNPTLQTSEGGAPPCHFSFSDPWMWACRSSTASGAASLSTAKKKAALVERPL